MALVDVNVKVAKEAYELSQGLAKFAGALKEATADGWDTTKDLPAVLASAMADLIPALNGVDKLGEEVKENQSAFYMALLVGSKDLLEVFTKKA